MNPDNAAITFSVGHASGEDDGMIPIGAVTCDAAGRLTLIDAEAAFRPALEDIVSAVNEQAELRIKVPPPPDAEPMSVFRRSVKRDEPDWLEALCDYVEQRFNLILTPRAAG